MLWDDGEYGQKTTVLSRFVLSFFFYKVRLKKHKQQKKRLKEGGAEANVEMFSINIPFGLINQLINLINPSSFSKAAVSPLCSFKCK